MIYKYIGSGTSNFIGTTYSGVTFSTSVEISGLSGSSLIFKIVSKTTGGTDAADYTPVKMMDPPDGSTGTAILLPGVGSSVGNAKTGQILIHRAFGTSSETPGTYQISIWPGSGQSIRLVESSVNNTVLQYGDVNKFGCFFYAFNTWWEY
jgi:hypothetical protein